MCTVRDPVRFPMCAHVYLPWICMKRWTLCASGWRKRMTGHPQCQRAKVFARLCNAIPTYKRAYTFGYILTVWPKSTCLANTWKPYNHFFFCFFSQFLRSFTKVIEPALLLFSSYLYLILISSRNLRLMTIEHHSSILYSKSVFGMHLLMRCWIICRCMLLLRLCKCI